MAVYKAILSAQIQTNAANPIKPNFTVQTDNDPKHAVKEARNFSMAKLVTCSQPSRACSSITEGQTESRKTYKQAKNEESCSKGLAKLSIW